MNQELTLVIGNKNYSSWSLRPWLVLRQFDIAFKEVRLPLDTPEFYQNIHHYSPSGRVPVLTHGDLIVWDSLAILEYVNEVFLKGRGWPSAVAARAVARSISAEMHSGFNHLRAECTFNCRRRLADFRVTPPVQRDIDRIGQIWRSVRESHAAEGPFLFGEFSIADAMYAPIVLRYLTYGIRVGAIEQDYCNAICALPAIQAWLADANAEAEVVAKYEKSA